MTKVIIDKAIEVNTLLNEMFIIHNCERFIVA